MEFLGPLEIRLVDHDERLQARCPSGDQAPLHETHGRLRARRQDNPQGIQIRSHRAHPAVAVAPAQNTARGFHPEKDLPLHRHAIPDSDWRPARHPYSHGPVGVETHRHGNTVVGHYDALPGDVGRFHGGSP